MLSTADHWIEQEVIFWPRSSQPHLLLLNPSSEKDAAFGAIELEAATLEPAPQMLDAAQNATASTDAKLSPKTEPRTVALYLSRPFLADAFGAQRSLDPATERPLDTWNTWQQAAERLTLYMQNAGYNTLVLTALNDGGAIFPLNRLHSTMRYDSGTYFSDGRSSEIKDLVELLCRHFDRCGLKLILSLDLNSPLPVYRNGNGIRSRTHRCTKWNRRQALETRYRCNQSARLVQPVASTSTS